MASVFSFLQSKKVLAFGAGTIVLLLGVMLVHIYVVTTPRSDGYVNSQLQLARIDIKGNATSQQCAEILHAVRNSTGVTNAFLNEPARVVTYTYVLGSTNAETVQRTVDNVTATTTVDNAAITTVRYQVPATTTGACPMNAQQTSWFRRIGSTMHQLLD